MNLPATVITCSDTASQDATADRSGPLLADLMAADGIGEVDRVIVADDRATIAAAVRHAIGNGARLVVTSGGTGLGPRDVTPEAIADLGARPVPGIGEAMRAAARARVPVTDLSRAGAWALDETLVVALPGSTGGVRDGWTIAAPLVTHAAEMLVGGSHPRPGAVSAAEANAPVPDLGSWVSGAVIDSGAVADQVSLPAAGAVVTFEGRVRDHDHGREVTRLTYEAHPGADDVLRATVAECLARPGVLAAAARHRIGDLVVGDLAYFVAVAAAHRGDAFEAGTWLVDAAKDRLPIWKHQVFADGTSEWVNCP